MQRKLNETAAAVSFTFLLFRNQLDLIGFFLYCFIPNY